MLRSTLSILRFERPSVQTDHGRRHHYTRMGSDTLEGSHEVTQGMRRPQGLFIRA
jgi:hypothetical protein